MEIQYKSSVQVNIYGNTIHKICPDEYLRKYSTKYLSSKIFKEIQYKRSVQVNI